ncbi:MAG TPA: rhodanese-like domain-containing protein [Burkholderiales bacterium]|nr:rhodanese-like domain-containing protein [Burkholderiales bacterium]
MAPTGEFTNIDATRLQELQAGRQPVLIDVRTDAEVGRGIIPGARHIPLQALMARFGEIERDRPVVFYCQSGARSAQASHFLAAQGWNEVYNLAGGIVGWAQRGLPIGSAG